MKSLRSICVLSVATLAFSLTAFAEKEFPGAERQVANKTLAALNARFDGKLAPKVLEQVAASAERLDVIVLLNEPDVAAALSSDWTESDILKTYMEAADRDLDAVINATSAADLNVRYRYRTISGFAGEVTAAGLEQLAKNPSVKSVSPNLPKNLFRVEGKNLMKVPAVHARGNRGAGVTVAVIDDGVDYSHPELGGTPIGQFPNSVVIGGYDFAAQVPEPSPGSDEDTHGTAVAGIIAGRGDSRGGTGVASAAKLVGLRVELNTASVIAALDWLVQNRTAVNPSIRVVNLSLGAGRFATACNGVLDLAGEEAAIARVANTGMIIVAAAGNDGWGGLAAPACFNQVISVGAVYDANIGPSPEFVTQQGASSCQDSSTAADLPTCYSNLAPNMTLRGPADNAYAPKAFGGYMEDFGGTSAAAPYTAGAVALLLEKFPTLSRSQVINTLRNSGKPIVEAGITVPRVDIDAALKSLGDTGGQPPTGPCQANASTLCLLGNRFAVTISATDQNGKNGSGHAVSIIGNDKFGFFSIPDLTGDTSNPEMLVKMLDARVIGSGFWVFYGPMTTFEVRITVRDTQKNVSKTFTKSAGNVIGGADTSSFTP